MSQQQPEDDWTIGRFVCERVCVTEKLVKKLGGAAQDATPGNCVTVCGTTRSDACMDACQRTVCTVSTHVPQWNESCLKRCQAECLRNTQQQQS